MKVRGAKSRSNQLSSHHGNLSRYGKSHEGGGVEVPRSNINACIIAVSPASTIPKVPARKCHFPRLDISSAHHCNLLLLFARLIEMPISPSTASAIPRI
jgi:hypothetical protein